MNILISMCLCKVPCRYDGRDVTFEEFINLSEKFNLVPVCPEIIGGLSTPRNPAERIGDKIVSNIQEDVTEQYVKGSKETLKLAQRFNCEIAILKEFSPSCGVHMIYDGSFTGNKIDGSGVTAQLLKENNIEVYSDLEIDKFLKKYQSK